MTVKLIECPICKGDRFKYLDYLRNPKYWYDKDMIFDQENLGFKVCQGCGFLTYDYIPEKDLQERYSRERVLVHPAVVETGNRKNFYHHHFLDGIVKPDWSVMDIGCAAGLFLDLCHKAWGIPHERLFGNEYCKPFAKYAHHEYGVNIIGDIDEYTPLSWDLISLYHVLEHMQNPDNILKLLHRNLKPGGFLYVSIPTYLDVLEDTAGPITDNFEGYFHLNHVNCFTRTSFLNLLAKTGWRVVKEDSVMYGMTVLLEPCEPHDDIVREDPELVELAANLQKAAIESLYKGVDESIRLWPKYPDAYIYKSLSEGRIKTFDDQVAAIKKGLALMPKNGRLKYQLASVLYQWDENTPDKEKRFWFSNNVREAEKLMLECVEEKPGNDDAFMKLAKVNMKYRKDYDTARKYLERVVEISPNKWAEVISLKGWMWGKLEEE